MTQNSQVQTVEARPMNEERPVFAPRYQLRHAEDAILLELDLPGVERDAIELQIDERTLSVRARRAAMPVPEGFRLSLREFEDCDYQRSFKLPAGFDAEQVEASYGHGILALTLRKQSPATRRIEVRQA